MLRITIIGYLINVAAVFFAMTAGDGLGPSPIWILAAGGVASVVTWATCMPPMLRRVL